jgi:hypothetical protein
MNKYFLFQFLISVLLASTGGQAKIISSKKFASIIDFKAPAGKTISVCGNNKIQLTKKSLSKDFLIGEPSKGFLITDLISYDEYWQILKSKNLEEAKSELKARLNEAHLWIVTPESSQSLGAPSSIELPFTATVKDCVEGAKTTLGNSCSGSAACCSEKFVGPVIIWKDQYRLGYSPDPSVRLTVTGDQYPRYCQVQDLIQMQTK